MSDEGKARLTSKLEAYERRTKHQIVVVTVKSLGGRDIAAFTRDLANAWGIGRKDYDDGVVVLVAPVERKVRIEVGRGLEKTLTNAAADDVIQMAMIPRFEAGEFEAGIEQGAEGVIKQLDRGERRPGGSGGS